MWMTRGVWGSRSHSGPRPLVGSAVIIDGHPYEVMDIDARGDIRVKDLMRDDPPIWVDVFSHCEIRYTNIDPGAVLEALAGLDDEQGVQADATDG